MKTTRIFTARHFWLNVRDLSNSKNGVQIMISSLRQNPQAIETAFLCHNI
jgi:uncharacterized protein YegL